MDDMKSGLGMMTFADGDGMLYYYQKDNCLTNYNFLHLNS